MQIQTVKGNAKREEIANRQGTRLTIRIVSSCKVPDLPAKPLTINPGSAEAK